MVRDDTGGALAQHSRRVFQQAFARGFMVTNFPHEHVEGRERILRDEL
jgi:hypothetical protein